MAGECQPNERDLPQIKRAGITAAPGLCTAAPLRYPRYIPQSKKDLPMFRITALVAGLALSASAFALSLADLS
jgi:hypothetical protein